MVQVHRMAVVNKEAQPIMTRCCSHEGLPQTELADAPLTARHCHWKSQRQVQHFSNVRERLARADKGSRVARHVSGTLP